MVGGDEQKLGQQQARPPHLAITPLTMAAHLARVFAFLTIGVGLFLAISVPMAAAEDQEASCPSGGCDDPVVLFHALLVGAGATVVAVGVGILFAAHQAVRGQDWARRILIGTFCLWSLPLLGLYLRGGAGADWRVLVLLMAALAIPILASWPERAAGTERPGP